MFIAIDTLIITLLGLPFIYLPAKKNIYRKLAHMWGKTILLFSFVKYDIENIQYIDESENYVFMCNHQSFYDVFLLLTIIRSNVVFIIKEELATFPLIKFLAIRAGYFIVERDNPRKSLQVLLKASQFVRKGESIIIFPEGTRSDGKTLLPFKNGSFIIAERSGVKILPIVIKGTSEIMNKDSYKISPFKKVTLKILPPITTEGVNMENIVLTTRKLFEDEFYA